MHAERIDLVGLSDSGKIVSEYAPRPSRSDAGGGREHAAAPSKPIMTNMGGERDAADARSHHRLGASEHRLATMRTRASNGSFADRRRSSRNPSGRSNIHDLKVGRSEPCGPLGPGRRPRVHQITACSRSNGPGADRCNLERRNLQALASIVDIGKSSSSLAHAPPPPWCNEEIRFKISEESPPIFASILSFAALDQATIPLGRSAQQPQLLDSASEERSPSEPCSV